MYEILKTIFAVIGILSTVGTAVFITLCYAETRRINREYEKIRNRHE